MAAFTFHTSRMHSLPLDPDKQQKEWEIIQLIARNKNFPKHLLQKLNRWIQHKFNHTQPSMKSHKIWTTFTYHSPKIRKITNLLKNTNIGIVFKTKTTSHHLVRTTPQARIPDHGKKWSIQNNKQHMKKAYVGQASRSLSSRFQEHTCCIKTKDAHSAYTLHIRNCRHECGNINDTITLLKQINEPTLLLPYEQIYIQ
jgi:hypothetical protein